MGETLGRWNECVRRAIAVVVGLIVLPSTVTAQEPANRCTVTESATHDSVTIELGARAVRVCFPNTAARGRPVFGYPMAFTDSRWMVPYDTLWRTGVIFETPVSTEIAGVAVQPGRYSIYAVPSSFEWTVIINGDVEHLAGGDSYEAVAEREIGRGMARSAANPEYVERLTLSSETSGTSSSDLVLRWERTEVRIPMRLTAARATLACEFRGAADRLASRPSPLDSVDIRIGGRRAKLCYGRPSARERVVFGGVVPYNDLWRLGANEPTILHVPFRASIASIAVEPGDYAILAVPGRREWTIVITASTVQWGRVETTARGARSQYSDAVRAREVGRTIVPSSRTDQHVETFTIRSEPLGTDGVNLVAEWERTRVTIPVRAR